MHYIGCTVRFPTLCFLVNHCLNNSLNRPPIGYKWSKHSSTSISVLNHKFPDLTRTSWQADWTYESGQFRWLEQLRKRILKEANLISIIFREKFSIRSKIKTNQFFQNDLNHKLFRSNHFQLCFEHLAISSTLSSIACFFVKFLREQINVL